MAATLPTSAPMIEALTPAQDDPELEMRLGLFVERFDKIIAHGGVVSIPDNPMGRLHFTALEVLDELALQFDPARVVVHLNTFHRLVDLDATLRAAADRGISHLLVVSGDGSPRLPRLEPEELGLSTKAVTSVELLDYIRTRYPSLFHCGVAFNHYEPADHEEEKLRRKLAAGAEFVITQPVLGADGRVVAAMGHGVPVWVGAWMSRKIELLYECVGATPPVRSPDAPAYDAQENLRLLRSAFPSAGLYLSMLGLKRDWSAILRGVGSPAPA